jgi:ABC-type multidrug transport system ATPase subunit
MEKEAMSASIETILKLIGLANDRNTLSKNLSGGMKRRLSIGISLVNDPKVCDLSSSFSFIQMSVCSGDHSR